MESNELRESLREAERAEASTWIDYPPTPRWWAPMFGLWSAVFALNIGYLDGLPQAGVSLLMAAFMGGVIGWQRRQRGTFPSGKAPREFRAAFVVLFVGALVVSGLAALAGSLLQPWVGAVVAGPAAWALVEWYERRYADVCDQVRARLDAPATP